MSNIDTKKEEYRHRLFEELDSYCKSDAEIARALGLSRPDSIYNVRKGRNLPNSELLLRIAEAFGDAIDFNYIFHGVRTRNVENTQEVKEGVEAYGNSIEKRLLEMEQMLSKLKTDYVDQLKEK